MKDNQLFTEYRDYLTDTGKSAHTVTAYLGDLRAFRHWYEQTYGEAFSPQAVGPRDISEYRGYLMRTGKKPNTINRRLAALQRYFKWAQRKGLASDNPFDILENYRVKQQTGIAPKWLERKQQLALSRVLRERGNKRDRAIVEILLRTGLRVSELASLTLDDVQIGERSGKVIVRQGKGGKYREVPLSKEVRRALEIYLAERRQQEVDTERIFLGQRGALRVAGVEYLVAKYAYHARLEDVTPHTLRHTFGKNMVDGGVSLEKVAALLGHESLETVRIYTEPSYADLERAVSQGNGDIVT